MYQISGEWALLARIFLGEQVELFTKRGQIYIAKKETKEAKKKHGEKTTYH